MAKVSVAEAAELLNVHIQRVHQLIASGTLPAERVGRQWIIDRADLARHDRRGAGRPLSARSAWNLLAVADDWGKSPSSSSAALSPSERSRANSRLREFLEPFAAAAPVDERDAASLSARVRSLLRNRAERQALAVSRRDLVHLREDERLALSGISLSESGMASGDVVEGYLEQDLLAGIRDEYLLVAVPVVDANVILHVFDPQAVRVSRIDPANWLLLAADLVEHHRPREQARGVELVRARANERFGL